MEKYWSNYLGEGFFQINKGALRAFGLEKALWIECLLEWRYDLFKKDKIEEDDYFYLSQNEIQNKTTISADKQTKIIKFFRDSGVIEVKKVGLPSRNYYRINVERMVELVEEDNHPEPTSDRKTRGLVNPDGGVILNKQINKETVTTKDKSFVDNRPEPDGSAVNFQSDDLSSGNHQKTPVRKFTRRITLPSRKDQVSAGINETFQRKALEAIPKKKQHTPMSIVPEEIKLIMEHWESLGFRLPNPEKAPASYNKTIRSLKKLLRGELIPGSILKFNPQDIKDTMDIFAKNVFDSTCGPTQPIKDQLAKKDLNDFLYNPHVRGIKSWFLECYGKEPQKRTDVKIEPDDHPSITNRLKTFYFQYVLGNIKTRPSVKEENHFRKASSRIARLYTQKGHMFPSVGDMLELADIWCSAIRYGYRNNTTRISPANFSSDHTLNMCIKYLNEKGYMTTDESNDHWNTGY